jgi:MtfA peptidase
MTVLFVTSSRRKRLRSQPFPPAWERVLERDVPLYGFLPPADQEELKGHIQVFLAEKQFDGAGGLVMTDGIRVTIAAQACLLLLHRDTDYFPGLSSVVVYPGEYEAPFEEMDEAGVVTAGTDRRSGESWDRGTLVLSWEDVLMSGVDGEGAYNVVLHEFAHQLDAEEGVTDGTPFFPKRAVQKHWQRTLEAEYERLKEDAARGKVSVLDPYGAESPAEFFAVATEAFFEDPRELREHHLALYEELSRYYQQDPAAWPLSIIDGGIL